ncbi:MAG: OmpA family protein [Simkaniaceae bacterium]
MKKYYLLFLISLTSCHHNSESVWDENSTAGNYINKAKSFFWRPLDESKAISSQEDFLGPEEDEFIPLKDTDLKTQVVDYAVAQSHNEPGTRLSRIPGIEGFKTPTGHMAEVIQTVYFNTDDHVLRNRDYYTTLMRIATLMKKNPNLYLFVSGHCDERASEAYNLALGTRRSNFVRAQIIKQGISANRVFNISYGKEMPQDLGHSRAAWAQNRRCEFKVYEKPTIVQR